MDNSKQPLFKCECGNYLTPIQFADLEGKTYYKLICKNCGTVYVENEPGSGEWSKEK